MENTLNINDRCIKVKEVESFFKQMTEKETCYYSGLHTFDSVAHIQGCELYTAKGYSPIFIVSRNCSLLATERSGDIYLLYYEGTYHKGSYKRIKTINPKDSQKPYEHPGGMQIIGDYLVCANETADYKDSYIQIYQIEPSTIDKAPNLKDVKVIDRKGEGAGMVGISNYTDNSGAERYVMVIGCGNSLKVYLSDEAKSLPECTFTKHFSTRVSDVLSGYDTTAFQCLNLITDVNNNIYMIGFQSVGTVSYDDNAVLCKLDLANKKINLLSINKKINTGAIFDVPHFRWGSCAHVLNENGFELITTERNSSAIEGYMGALRFFNPKAKTKYRYEIKVKTADEIYASTGSRVYVILNCGQKSTHRLCLNDYSEKTLFERGNEDTIMIDLEQDYGNVTQLDISFDYTGAGAAWKCDNIVIKSPNGTTATFQVQKWFEDTKWYKYKPRLASSLRRR